MYNKLFTKILDSSIWLEPDATRLVWITFLAVMDEDGFVALSTVGNVAARARVPSEDAERAVECLQNPDKFAGDQEFDGRRIERVPNGWMVLNAGKYRDMITRIVVREATRQRVAKHRASKNPSNADVTTSNIMLQNVTPSDTVSYTKSVSDTELPCASNNAREAKRKKRPEDPIWDALLAVCGLILVNPTPSERGAWNKAVQALRAVNATPEDIQARGSAYRKRWPNVSLTPSALARRWNECVAMTAIDHVSASRPDDYYRPDGTVNSKYA